MAGRDEYGGSNVFGYFSGSEETPVYAETHLERVAQASESLMGDDWGWQLGDSRSGKHYQRHTTATARESTVSRGLWPAAL